MQILRMLGVGRLPSEADALIPPRDRAIVCEHLFCSITFRNFRSPGRVCSWKRQWFFGSIAVSGNHIIAFRGRRRLINTSFEDSRFPQVSVTSDADRLFITHDAGLYRDDWTGKIEYRFATPEANQIAAMTLRSAAGTLVGVT